MSTPTPTKFYHAENTNRFLVGPSGTKFSFTPTKLFAGVWRGVYRTDKPGEQADLDAMVKDPARGVTELTEAEYLSRVQKKSISVKDFKPMEKLTPQEPPAKAATPVAATPASEAGSKEKVVEVPEEEVAITAPVSPRRRRGSSAAVSDPAEGEKKPTAE